MGAKSAIEWTESTWNPVTGCTKASPGCKNCYAERMACRLQSMGVQNYRDGFNVRTHEHTLALPLQWKKPQAVFVNSMSDLFHEDVSTDFILRVFEIMRKAYWHRFQILTKRAERLLELNPVLEWTPNIWMGVSVESDDWLYRVDCLHQTGASIKFLSLEPLLSSLPHLDLGGIDWVIVGGESGPHARPLSDQWVKEIRDKCNESTVPFFFKQWGGVNKKKAGRLLDGRVWEQMPAQASA